MPIIAQGKIVGISYWRLVLSEDAAHFGIHLATVGRIVREVIANRRAGLLLCHRLPSGYLNSYD